MYAQVEKPKENKNRSMAQSYKKHGFKVNAGKLLGVPIDQRKYDSKTQYRRQNLERVNHGFNLNIIQAKWWNRNKDTGEWESQKLNEISGKEGFTSISTPEYIKKDNVEEVKENLGKLVESHNVLKEQVTGKEDILLESLLTEEDSNNKKLFWVELLSRYEHPELVRMIENIVKNKNEGDSDHIVKKYVGYNKSFVSAQEIYKKHGRKLEGMGEILTPKLREVAKKQISQAPGAGDCYLNAAAISAQGANQNKFSNFFKVDDDGNAIMEVNGGKGTIGYEEKTIANQGVIKNDTSVENEEKYLISRALREAYKNKYNQENNTSEIGGGRASSKHAFDMLGVNIKQVNPNQMDMEKQNIVAEMTFGYKGQIKPKITSGIFQDPKYTDVQRGTGHVRPVIKYDSKSITLGDTSATTEEENETFQKVSNEFWSVKYKYRDNNNNEVNVPLDSKSLVKTKPLFSINKNVKEVIVYAAKIDTVIYPN